jgi:hypothetical protein
MSIGDWVWSMEKRLVQYSPSSPSSPSQPNIFVILVAVIAKVKGKRENVLLLSS